MRNPQAQRSPRAQLLRGSRVAGAPELGIYELLVADHRELRRLCGRILKTGDAESPIARKSFGELKKLLVAHSKAEERVFYDTLKAKSVESEDGILKDLVLGGFEEHRVTELLVNELVFLEPDDERWMPKMRLLRELLFHHIKEEEGNLFKQARAQMGKNQIAKKESLQLGRLFAQREREMLLSH